MASGGKISDIEAATVEMELAAMHPRRYGSCETANLAASSRLRISTPYTKDRTKGEFHD